MAGSNFPNGFKNTTTVRGIPLSQTHPGEVFWVNSSTTGAELAKGAVGGSNGNDGSYKRPFATIDYAIGKCSAGRGDVIAVMPGSDETVASAGAITADVVGIAIVGVGEGQLTPTLTFSDTASTFIISAADVTVANIVGVPSVDSVVSPFVISGAGCTLDVEWRDASAAVEALRAVLTTATADRLNINMRYVGFIAGNAGVNAIRLVGCNTGNINIDYYGVCTTGIVEFHTTACDNVKVTGNFYVSGTTDLSLNVVDTVTGSTWTVQGFDGAAGSAFSGGSGGAVAIDDVGALHAVPVADAATNVYMRDVVGIKTDAAAAGAVSAVESLMAYAKQIVTAGIAAAASLLAGVPATVIKSTGDMTAGGTTVNLFTVTGDVLARVVGSVDVALTCTSGTSTLSVGVAGNVQALIPNDAIDAAAFQIGDSWSFATAADANAAAADTGWVVIGNGVDIIQTTSVDDITAGDMDYYCTWIPLSVGATVVAA